MTMLRRRKFFALVFTFATLPPVAATAKPIQMSWVPRSIAAGSPCLFRAEVAGPLSSLRGTWLGHQITFFPAADPHVWYGLAGVDVEAKPGSYKLDLEATLADGKLIRDERTVRVRSAKYKTEALTVPDRFVQPDAETLRRIESERKIKDAAFSHQTAAPEWSGKFVAPIDSTVSEGFGTRRTFNGKLASIHRGLDYHAKSGSPVVAANSGEVVLAQELFYEGNCVIIDHGQQFMTLYMHLSRMDVSAGEKAKKGQQIGLSGATGRVTGPHLHVAVRWQGAYLDPARLWTLPLPTAP
ncbi:MAG: M23 family metallopeptidase [Candidatus Korobacteraceae bacterium]|jgi:peptidase M23-like protein